MLLYIMIKLKLNFGLSNIIRKRKYCTLEVQMLMPNNKLIQNKLNNRFNIKE